MAHLSLLPQTQRRVEPGAANQMSVPHLSHELIQLGTQIKAL